MKGNLKINPTGLKGNQITERMKELMGVTPINENVSRSVVELTKIGPDGKAYGIVRENHEYYIKVSDKTSNLVPDDFKYIGGLQNKKKEVNPSYAKATKHLNLKFKSLAEAYGRGSDINVFEDDNLLAEHHPYKADQALSATKGIGDSQEYVEDKEGTKLSSDAKEGTEEGQFGDNLADGKVKNDIEKVKIDESGFAAFGSMNGNGFEKGGMFGDDIEMSEEERYIDRMLEDEDEYVDYTMGRQNDPNQLPNPARELHIPVDEYDNGMMMEPSNSAANGLDNIIDVLRQKASEAGMSLDMFIDKIGQKLHGGEGFGLTESKKLSISRAIEHMDELIDGLKKKAQ